MNIHPNDLKPETEEAKAALALLRDWVAKASDAEINALDPAVAQLLPGQGVSRAVARLSAGFRRGCGLSRHAA